MEKTFYDKDELIKELTDLASSRKFVFRGYSIQDQLKPNIIRNNATDIELELLYQFEKYANQYISANNPIDLLSYAQHFGLSTRLLDFTYNPFVALYFALFKAKPNNASNPDDNKYYYIRYCDLDDNICLEEIPIINEGQFFTSLSMAEKCSNLFKTLDVVYNKNEENSVFNKQTFIKTINHMARNKENPLYDVNTVSEKIDKYKILLIDPNQSNQRIIMQQGLFMICFSLDPTKHRLIIENNTHLIKIDKRIRDELQMYLNTIGINAFRLMPDLTSVCEAVERQVKEKRNKKSNLFKKAIVTNRDKLEFGQ